MSELYLIKVEVWLVQQPKQVFGKAHVFYPETSAERCTAALLLVFGINDLCSGEVPHFCAKTTLFGGICATIVQPEGYERRRFESRK